MSLATDLRTFLLGDATLSGLIGTRLHPVTLPQNPTLPALTYQIITGTRWHSNDGAVGLSSPRIQFDAWAATYLEAESVFEALRKRLDGFSGTMGGSPGTTVQGAFYDSERDLYEPEPKLYRRSADWFLFVEEAVS